MTYTLKCWLNFKGLHGIIPQKTKLFIITAARTSYPLSVTNLKTMSKNLSPDKKTSVALSLQANYTDRTTATGRRNFSANVCG
jgi:hypothetical protein